MTLHNITYHNITYHIVSYHISSYRKVTHSPVMACTRSAASTEGKLQIAFAASYITYRAINNVNKGAVRWTDPGSWIGWEIAADILYLHWRAWASIPCQYHDMTWHDMTWHVSIMTWHDMTWHVSIMTWQYHDMSVSWHVSIMTCQYHDMSVSWHVSIMTCQYHDMSVSWHDMTWHDMSVSWHDMTWHFSIITWHVSIMTWHDMTLTWHNRNNDDMNSSIILYHLILCDAPFHSCVWGSSPRIGMMFAHSWSSCPRAGGRKCTV